MVHLFHEAFAPDVLPGSLAKQRFLCRLDGVLNIDGTLLMGFICSFSTLMINTK